MLKYVKLISISLVISSCIMGINYLVSYLWSGHIPSLTWRTYLMFVFICMMSFGSIQKKEKRIIDNSLLRLSFINTNGCNCFGNAGMIFNIISLSLQLVSSDVIVPHEMLSKTYQTISELFPATYVANGYYTIIFGGVSLERNIISLLVIVLVTQSVAVMILAIKGMAKGRGSSVVKVV